jgi:hypothetical protein
MIFSTIAAKATYNYTHADEYGEYFLPGDTVTGRVDFFVKHSLRLKTAALAFWGRSRSVFRYYDGQNSHYYSGDAMLVDPQLDQKFPIGSLPYKLEPGLIYQWPFTFTLPLETTYTRPETIRWRKVQSLNPNYEDGPHPLPTSNGNIVYTVSLCFVKTKFRHKMDLPFTVRRMPVESIARLTEPTGLEMLPLRSQGRSSGMWPRKSTSTARTPPALRLHARMPNDIHESMSLAISAGHDRAITHTQSFTVIGVDLKVKHLSLSRTFRTYGGINQDSFHDCRKSEDPEVKLRAQIKLAADGRPMTVVDGVSFVDLAANSAVTYTTKTYNILDAHVLKISVHLQDDDSGHESTFMVKIPWVIDPVVMDHNANNSISSTAERLLQARIPEMDSTNQSISEVLGKQDEHDNDSIIVRRVYEVTGDDDIAEVRKPRLNGPSSSKRGKMSTVYNTDGASDDESLSWI